MDKVKMGELNMHDFVLLVSCLGLAIRDLGDTEDGEALDKVLRKWEDTLDEDAALKVKKMRYAAKMLSIMSMDDIIAGAKAAKEATQKPLGEE